MIKRAQALPLRSVTHAHIKKQKQKKKEGESLETRLVFILKELNAEVGAVWLRARLVQARPNYVNSADTSRILMT